MSAAASAPVSTFNKDKKMLFQNLGGTGLQVSRISFGCMTFGQGEGFLHNAKVQAEQGYEMMKLCYESGINYFDNAENYGNAGASETVMGQAVQIGIERGTWERCDLVLSTKLYFGGRGTKDNLNTIGLSRKHIVEGIKASLKRMQLEYVDLVFAHRPDPLVPIEETVRAFNHIIEKGYAFYWGTSEWSAQQLTEARQVAERLNLVPPFFDQTQYSLIERQRVEFEYAPLYPQLGLTIWSPLAGGALSGKYLDQKEADDGGNRFGQIEKNTSMIAVLLKPMMVRATDAARALKPVADELGCTLAQLAIAWCLANPHVSTVLTGATRIEQLQDTLKSLDVVPKLTPDVLKRIDDLTGTKPVPDAVTQMVHGLRVLPARSAGKQ